MCFYNKQQVEQTKVDIHKVIEEWGDVLGISDWTLNVVFTNKIRGCDRSTYAACFPRWYYKEATIALKKRKVVGLAYAELEKLLLHEMFHCVVAQGFDENKYDKNEEIVVSNLTNIALWIRDKYKNQIASQWTTSSTADYSTASFHVGAGQ